MSQLVLKQRIMSWNDSYDVTDIDGRPIWFVKADLFSFGKCIRVYDKETRAEIAVIKESVFSFMKQFTIFINGEKEGKIERQMSLFEPKFTVDFKDWLITGNFMGLSFKATLEGNEIFTISKKILAFGDTYVIDCRDDKDDLAALIVTIAIDAACHDNQTGGTL